MQNNNETLTQAFAAFNSHSAGLHAAYEQLQVKVAILAEALNDARRTGLEQQSRQRKVTARYAELMEALPAVVVVTDDAGTVVDANARALTVFGDALMHSPWTQHETRHFRTRAIDGADVYTGHGRIFNAARSALAGGGEIIVFSDVTDARTAIDATHRHQRLALLGEMAARMAHQIRTPLSAAMLYAAQPAPSAVVQSKLMARLQALATLVDDMLRFASGTSDEYTTMNSGHLLCQVADEARDMLDDGITLNVAATGASFEFSANRPALIGALHNLIANAVQHMDGRGRILLADGEDAHGNLILTVTDNGPGIAPELREKIFDPFFTTRANGTGLGLAIVRSVLRAHDGDVACDVTDAGTVFALRLPSADRVEKGFVPADDVPQFAISAGASSAFSKLRSVSHV
ncbi:MAG: ATP-binding protein [Pseudomonadota bacterium]